MSTDCTHDPQIALLEASARDLWRAGNQLEVVARSARAAAADMAWSSQSAQEFARSADAWADELCALWSSTDTARDCVQRAIDRLRWQQTVRCW